MIFSESQKLVIEEVLEELLVNKHQLVSVSIRIIYDKPEIELKMTIGNATVVRKLDYNYIWRERETMKYTLAFELDYMSSHLGRCFIFGFDGELPGGET